MEEALNKLIAGGLMQPKSEPTFFSYPSGYDLVAPSTGYNTVALREDVTAVKVRIAELESSSR